MLTIWMSYWYWCVASPQSSELESLLCCLIIIIIIILVLSAAPSQPVTSSLAGRTSTFGSGSNREDKVETPVNSGPDPCLPEICDKMWVSDNQRELWGRVSYLSCFYCRCCSCLDDTWIHGKWYLFRSVIHDIVDNPFFEWTVLLLIFASRSGSCLSPLWLN